MLVDESMVASLNLDDAEGSSIYQDPHDNCLTNGGAAMADGSITREGLQHHDGSKSGCSESTQS